MTTRQPAEAHFRVHPGCGHGNDAYELQRRLGHQSQRYTNLPADTAAGYVEGL